MASRKNGVKRKSGKKRPSTANMTDMGVPIDRIFKG